jgi:glycogen debranching enzyme
VPYRIFSVFDGSTFVVSNGRGDLDAAPDRLHGFFSDDTRYLSRWLLTLDGEELDSLSIADMEYFALRFFLVPPPETVWENPSISVIRRRLVRGTWIEELAVMNHGDAAVDVQLDIEVDSDFADMFEVRDGDVRDREVRREAAEGRLVLSYRRGEFLRETRIAASAGCDLTENGFRSHISLDPGEGRWLSFDISPRAEPRQAGLPNRTRASSFETTRGELRDELDAWISDAPSLETDWDGLSHVYQQSLVDLAALRIFPEILPGASLPAAGLPWFMALFGRDSLITSYQALPMRPELARTTLLALAASQAGSFDDFRDAEPGKILHELRFGELTVTGERPHSPYYGTADATPLFLILLDELERWTGDSELALRLEPNARAALEWINLYGDLDGDGYVEYRRRNEETGLENQCWKDSNNSILFADGSKAAPPIASCEIQGYVYDAKRRCARLATDVWGDPALAERLEREAAELRRRFHEDFWIEDGGYYALALDGEKQKVDSLTSNIGHLLWSGIVDPEPAASIVEHLMGDRLFSGWGVRTMAVGDVGYNPIEYHNGTVWPHENSLIAHGLGRYGYRAQAAGVGMALVEAADHFAYRLPEVFTGYSRDLTDFPVQYPTASRPQAWATGAPLLFIRTLLGLEPAGEALVMDPWLPDRIERLALRRIPGRWGRADAVADKGWAERAALEEAPT